MTIVKLKFNPAYIQQRHWAFSNYNIQTQKRFDREIKITALDHLANIVNLTNLDYVKNNFDSKTCNPIIFGYFNEINVYCCKTYRAYLFLSNQCRESIQDQNELKYHSIVFYNSLIDLLTLFPVSEKLHKTNSVSKNLTMELENIDYCSVEFIIGLNNFYYKPLKDKYIIGNGEHMFVGETAENIFQFMGEQVGQYKIPLYKQELPLSRKNH